MIDYRVIKPLTSFSDLTMPRGEILLTDEELASLSERTGILLSPYRFTLTRDEGTVTLDLDSLKELSAAGLTGTITGETVEEKPEAWSLFLDGKGGVSHCSILILEMEAFNEMRQFIRAIKDGLGTPISKTLTESLCL